MELRNLSLFRDKTKEASGLGGSLGGEEMTASVDLRQTLEVTVVEYYFYNLDR